MLPAWHFTRAILVRSLGIWLGVRAVVTGGNRALQDPAVPPEPLLELTAVAAVGVVVLVAGLVLLDAGRRNELLFLANLGVGRAVIGGLAVSVAGLVELIIAVAVAAT
ncbi:MAG: hypothetical protein O7I93_05260 [Gemmatimonadetes bacterium]|nr:hypothetical protein [Gemmatimonadota bacterium]